jgi:hypothetical protein
MFGDIYSAECPLFSAEECRNITFFCYLICFCFLSFSCVLYLLEYLGNRVGIRATFRKVFGTGREKMFDRETSSAQVV